MGSATLVSIGDYLHSSFEPDADFVDGLIEERPVGERDHSDLQSHILLMLSQAQCKRFFVCRSELRVQTSPQRFRVPDLCLLAVSAPREQIVITPPLLCIEILSPEDRVQRTSVKVRDFLGMGVPEVWVVDPESRTVQVCAGATATEHSQGSIPVPGTDISISLEEMFSVLDPS